MNFKIFLLISLLAVSSIYSFDSASVENQSFESASSSSSTSVDCDLLYVEAEDKGLIKFLTRNGLLHEYERRNENQVACLEFLGKFFSKIEQYRKEEGKQEDFKLNKRGYKKKPKGAFNFKY
jgi:hypothetical protein